MTEERRREPRLDAQRLGLHVYDNLQNRLLGALIDLSRRGLLIHASTRCEVGGALQIDLRPAERPEQAVLTVGMRVVWVNPASTPGSFWVGGRFIGLTGDDRRVLVGLVERAGAA